tara:strand:+ start:4323 stop:5594 length:1272 start_codon:yes stop_codon:yes gene_type:complete
MIKWQDKRLIIHNRLTAYIIGFGLVISLINLQANQILWFKYGSFSQIGFLISIIFLGFYLSNMKREEINLDNKLLWIPLCIIAGIIIIRPIYAWSIKESHWGLYTEIAGAGYALYLIALYIISKRIGTNIIKPFTIGVIIISISIIILGILNPGIKNGGLISNSNYNIATGFLIFGVLISSIKKQWWLSAIAIIGLYFTGADEAIFSIGILGLAILIRKDFSRKLLLPIGALTLTLLICTPLGITQKLYLPTIIKTAATKELLENTLIGEALNKIIPDTVTKTLDNVTLVRKETDTTEVILNEMTGFRWLDHRISSIKPLGYGYNINFFYWGIPHNTPLIILEQIGVIPMLAWLWVVGYGIIKTRYKYAWISIGSLSVFDHFIWTQAAPWFWLLAGISNSNNIGNDLIFRKTENEKFTPLGYY